MKATPSLPPEGFFRTLRRVARAVFHETVGALFFLLALAWLSATLRLWQREPMSSWLLVASGIFALVLIAFGILSFRAARRVR
jgi:hypothetical protein